MAGGASKDSSPATWSDALSEASQAIAAGLSAPDADVKFGLAIIGALSTHQKKGQQQPGQPQSGGAGAGAPGGPTGGGDAGSPLAGGPPPGAQQAGGGAPNPSMPGMAAPGGPVPGGMSPGLSPNPDELRRVLADVAGQ